MLRRQCEVDAAVHRQAGLSRPVDEADAAAGAPRYPDDHPFRQAGLAQRRDGEGAGEVAAHREDAVDGRPEPARRDRDVEALASRLDRDDLCGERFARTGQACDLGRTRHDEAAENEKRAHGRRRLLVVGVLHG